MRVLLLFTLLCCAGAVRMRHRREPDPQEWNVRKRQEEQVQNRFKPRFANCDDYRPEVEENSPRGTRVFQVRAIDDDGEEGPNGQVTYSIVSQHHKFQIDPKTGWLTTSAVFNRDEPDREKKVHVTVKATDHGRPQLEDVCTLAVTIIDKNDNAPVFDRASYDLPIAQDMAVDDLIMRISATDVDEGQNAQIHYNLEAKRYPGDLDYFRWNYETGEVRLANKLDKPASYVFQLVATATDQGNPPKSSETYVTLEVKESFNKPPKFIQGPGLEIELSESYAQFSEPIATYTAESNIPDDENVFFQLLTGRTEDTNKENTFRAVPVKNQKNAVHIFLAKTLEYEAVSKYTLTLQVQNSPGLVAEAVLKVNVKDENNRAPVFTNVESGTVLEHEPPGTVVMQVTAVDLDGTYPNDQVTYAISERNDQDIIKKFTIDPNTGVITTKEEFDREEKGFYALVIDARDGAPSSVLNNGEPNITPQKFRITIGDVNDNPPYFPQQVYNAEVPEDQDVGSKVIEVRAEDKDEEASITTYQIVGGNQGKAFRIEDKTGLIRVAKPLDYETIPTYTLQVVAWDGEYSNQTTVQIDVLNVNDMKPQFTQAQYKVEQEEETKPSYPIISVKAIDPDIGDESVDQNITYYLDSSSDRAKYFSIDPKTGEIRIVKELDRDLPDGFPTWNIYIFAKDENGGPTGIENYVELIVDLKDINDNAPFLDMGDGLVWGEEQNPGTVGTLVADDYDTPENGPPYIFSLDSNADNTIKEKFAVSQIDNGSFVLDALVTFDREELKTYSIPINICDKFNLCDVDYLTLTIGDINDNPMKEGYSEIFVYNYEGRSNDIQIGRVFVEDPDDWDLPDKTFRFSESNKFPDFGLDSNTGMITLKKGIQLYKELTSYVIKFLVDDPKHQQFNVPATVNVTIQKLPKEAVLKSGSVRIKGTPEDFIQPDPNGFSKRDKFKAIMSKYLNTTYVDVFTVLLSKGRRTHKHEEQEFYTDVRFSAHGSPYYKPEKLEGILTKRKMDLYSQLALDIVMIHIDECMIEGQNCQGGSCVNHLQISDNPIAIMTNKTSFVGVNAKIVPYCGCHAPVPKPNSCDPNPCLNNGTCRNAYNGYTCDCPADNKYQFGPNCERLAASFNGQGWSWQRGLSACGNSFISLIFKTQADGTMLYVGPSPNNIVQNVTDFLALEIVKGKLKMFVNFGSGTKILDLEQKVTDNKEHTLVLRWTNDTVQMELDDNTCSNDVSQKRNQCFLQITTHDMRNRYLNTNGPLHVGGVSFGAERFSEVSELLNLNRQEMPQGYGFAGCIRNLTYSAAGRAHLYDLGNPSDGENFTPGCDDEFVQAITALGINTNFLIAILVCLLVILVLVVILAVYRKRRHVFGDKDLDCDIRENIINYSDEGGGEGDQTGYDLSVLRMMSDGTPALHAGDQKKNLMHLNEPPPDIQTFLETNKDRIDGDPDATPFDDLRHYAYEGDGNSGASLSSLNSGTSDGDLEFEYLHNFGPRFKKLADMYGEEPDSEEDEDGEMPPPLPPHHQQQRIPLPSESWC